MTHEFRIAPTNNIVIEWRAKKDGAQWCFYLVADSRNDAERILALLTKDIQATLFEVTA